MLKANYDAGRDHITMFMPFLLDAVASLSSDDFDVQTIQAAVYSRHHLSVPDGTLRTLLQRAAGRGAVKREHGRYFRNRGKLQQADLTEARRRVEAEQALLAVAFRTFAASRSRPIADDEEAFALLFGFLADNEIAMVLDETAPVDGAHHTRLAVRDTRLAARFINDVCLPNAELGAYLKRAIEGMVLQNVLLLRDIALAPRRFINLVAFLDTGVLLRALGFEGEPAKVAARESLDLLRDTNARLAVFEKTVDEIKRILAILERKLSTAEGRRALVPTELTRFFLSKHYSPADVRQASALLERNLAQLGVDIRPMPPRDERYTRDEAALTRALQRPGTGQDAPVEPRVLHDVDCVAAICTLRANKTPETLDDALAVFVTTNPEVVRSINGWWRTNKERGISPVIHNVTLSNAAWLKRPTTATDLKLRELIALCAAALRPSRVVWDRFLQHLRKLEESGELSSDEAVAVTASGLTDKLLSDFEDDDGIDANTLDDIVERVKATYRADADKLVTTAEAQASTEGERRRELELRVRSMADQAARAVALIAFLPVAAVMVIGSWSQLPGAFPTLGSWSAIVGWVATVLVSGLGVYLLFLDPLRGWRQKLEARLRTRFRQWLLGRSSESFPAS
jgi:hypothetical protein